MKKCCIFLHSGSFDRVYQAVSITNIILACSGEVHIFLSYGALKRFVKGNVDKPDIEGEFAPFKEEFDKNLKRGTIDRISEIIKTAKMFGRLKIYACTASMAILNIALDDLVDDVDSCIGLVAFMELVKDADLTLYI
jgi:peroxiredoxin family protein